MFTLSPVMPVPVVFGPKSNLYRFCRHLYSPGVVSRQALTMMSSCVGSPRLVEGKMPIKHVTDLNDVNLAQVVLHRKKKMMHRLKNVLQDNPQ